MRNPKATDNNSPTSVRVRVLSVNSLYYANIFRLARQGFVKPEPRAGEEETQKEASRAVSQLLLHGCQMSR